MAAHASATTVVRFLPRTDGNSNTTSPPLSLAVLALRSLIQHLATQQQQQQGPHPRPLPRAPTPTRLVVLAHTYCSLPGNTLLRTLEVSRKGMNSAHEGVCW